MARTLFEVSVVFLRRRGEVGGSFVRRESDLCFVLVSGRTEWFWFRDCSSFFFTIFGVGFEVVVGKGFGVIGVVVGAGGGLVSLVVFFSSVFLGRFCRIGR